MYTSIRRSSPGKLCVGSVLAMCVLDHPWETMSWITPGKLCVASALGNCVLSALVLSFWVPRFGSRVWADRAHGPWPIGPGCVASRLVYYVLHQCLEDRKSTRLPRTSMIITIMMIMIIIMMGHTTSSSPKGDATHSFQALMQHIVCQT